MNNYSIDGKNSKIYLVLSRMAQEFLTLLVSTGASESAFSDSNQMLDERRNQMAPSAL